MNTENTTEKRLIRKSVNKFALIYQAFFLHVLNSVQRLRKND